MDEHVIRDQGDPQSELGLGIAVEQSWNRLAQARQVFLVEIQDVRPTAVSALERVNLPQDVGEHVSDLLLSVPVCLSRAIRSRLPLPQ
jgi:hypothetical protein